MLPSINYVTPIVSNVMKRTPFESSGFEVKGITAKTAANLYFTRKSSWVPHFLRPTYFNGHAFVIVPLSTKY